jgi:hypothetical protein
MSTSAARVREAEILLKRARDAAPRSGRVDGPGAALASRAEAEWAEAERAARAATFAAEKDLADKAAVAKAKAKGADGIRPVGEPTVPAVVLAEV